MFIERPLASLPEDRAAMFLRQLGAEHDAGDTTLFTLGFQKVAANWQDAGGPAAFEPIGLFGYRALGDRTGLAFAASMLDMPRAVDLEKTMFLAIAHKARIAGHERLFVVTPDHRVRRTFAAFGMVFPAELQLESYLVGYFDLTDITRQESRSQAQQAA